MIAVLDFGSQYTHLITRRIRELGVKAQIYPPSAKGSDLSGADGIVLSGGPSSVFEKNSPKPHRSIFEMGVPILGICYGAQLIAHLFGGKVSRGKVGEYGRAKVYIKKDSKLTRGVPREFYVWMSHGDTIFEVPENFVTLGTSEHSPVALFCSEDERIWGVQFHPEVVHTEYGDRILENFVFGICGARRDWNLEDFLKSKLEEVSKIEGNVVCAVSGGVDSTVLAVFLHRAVGRKLIPIFVDTGLLRKGERDEVVKNFKRLGIDVIVEDAGEVFFRKLKGVVSPERKRKIIGRTFVEVFESAIARRGIKAEYLAQGTLYPDVIESGRSRGPAAVIKTHHNVGGLPRKLNFKLIEPFRELYKDEVRKIGKLLGVPDDILYRHPFPGPGLAVRIMGRVTPEKVRILQEVDDIFVRKLKKWELYPAVWQAFCVLTNTKSTGVVGDRRRYGWVVAIRCVDASDGMTADWSRLPYDFLDEVAREIVGSVPEVSRVVYDITSKPPATIEWE